MDLRRWRTIALTVVVVGVLVAGCGANRSAAPKPAATRPVSRPPIDCKLFEAPGADGLSGLAQALPKFAQALKKGDHITVTTVGASIASGWLDEPSTLGFRGRFLRWLGKAYPQATIVDHSRAVPGSRTIDAKDALLGQWLEEDKPNLVLIAWGINDIPGTPVKDYTQNVKREVELAKSSGAEVLLLTPPRTKGSAVGGLVAEPKYVDALRSVGTSAHVAVVDLYEAGPVLVKAQRLSLDQISADLVHPNQAGHLLYLRAMQQWAMNVSFDNGAACPMPQK